MKIFFVKAKDEIGADVTLKLYVHESGVDATQVTEDEMLKEQRLNLYDKTLRRKEKQVGGED